MIDRNDGLDWMFAFITTAIWWLMRLRSQELSQIYTAFELTKFSTQSVSKSTKVMTMNMGAVMKGNIKSSPIIPINHDSKYYDYDSFSPFLIPDL